MREWLFLYTLDNSAILSTLYSSDRVTGPLCPFICAMHRANGNNDSQKSLTTQNVRNRDIKPEITMQCGECPVRERTPGRHTARGHNLVWKAGTPSRGNAEVRRVMEAKCLRGSICSYSLAQKCIVCAKSISRNGNIKSCVNIAVKKKVLVHKMGMYCHQKKCTDFLLKVKNTVNTRYSGTMTDSSLKYPNTSKFT